jgi:hypothetical protein
MSGWKGGYVDLHQVWPTYIIEIHLFIIYLSRWVWYWIEIRKTNFYTIKINYRSKRWTSVIEVFFSILQCYRGDQTVYRGQMFGPYKHLFVASLRSVVLRLTEFFYHSLSPPSLSLSLCEDDVIGIFHRHNPSDRTMALGSTQPLTEMSNRRISWG